MKSDKKYPKHYTLSVVYPADEIDLHGDTMTAEDLEKAAWAAGARRVGVGLMHRRGTEGAGTVVESYIYRGPDWPLKDTSGQKQTIKGGDWVMGIRWADEAWKAIMDGQVTGLSLQGVAQKVAKSLL